jgi:hypothetical protein
VHVDRAGMLAVGQAHVELYHGQTMSVLGCGAKVTGALTAFGLTSSSPVTQVLTAANALINNSKSGGATTQTKAGDMKALLGNCANQE